MQPTYVVQEGKPIAFFRLALDYVGSQTDAHGMLVCNGARGLMESVFLKQPKVAAPKSVTKGVQDAQSGEAHEDHQGGHQARPGETAPQPAN